MSCEGDTLTDEALPVPESAAPATPNKLTGLVASSEGGMFHFTDFEAFNAALDAVAPMTTKPFSEASLRALESRLGVETMQGAYLEKVTQFDTDGELPADWMAENSFIIVPFEEGISPAISDIALRTLINKEGRVKVGSDMYIFTRDIQVLIKNNPDESLIQIAIDKATSNVEEGVFVQVDWQDSSEDIGQKMCDGEMSLGCTSSEVDDHRVRGNWGYYSTFQSTPNQTCFGPPGNPFFCQTTSVTFTTTHRYFANAKVEDRGWFNRWTRDVTRLSFTCGVRASGLSGSGMGWTSPSNVHEIDVSWSAGPSTTVTLPAGTGGTPSPPSNTLDYVTGGVDDEDIAGLFCFRCCPWDCANSDENDIP